MRAQKRHRPRGERKERTKRCRRCFSGWADCVGAAKEAAREGDGAGLDLALQSAVRIAQGNDQAVQVLLWSAVEGAVGARTAKALRALDAEEVPLKPLLCAVKARAVACAAFGRSAVSVLRWISGRRPALWEWAPLPRSAESARAGFLTKLSDPGVWRRVSADGGCPQTARLAAIAPLCPEAGSTVQRRLFDKVGGSRAKLALVREVRAALGRDGGELTGEAGEGNPPWKRRMHAWARRAEARAREGTEEARRRLVKM